jgi:hypothetical protein
MGRRLTATIDSWNYYKPIRLSKVDIKWSNITRDNLIMKVEFWSFIDQALTSKNQSSPVAQLGPQRALNTKTKLASY